MKNPLFLALCLLIPLASFAQAVASSNTKVAAVALKWDVSAAGESHFTITPILRTN